MCSLKERNDHENRRTPYAQPALGTELLLNLMAQSVENSPQNAENPPCRGGKIDGVSQGEEGLERQADRVMACGSRQSAERQPRRPCRRSWRNDRAGKG